MKTKRHGFGDVGGGITRLSFGLLFWTRRDPMVDDILVFAVAHYVVFGLALLCAGIALNLLFQCGPDLIEAIRHPKLH